MRPKYKAPLPVSDQTHAVCNVASKETCSKCNGSGAKIIYGKTSVVCDCVYRSCFRKCILRHRNNLLNTDNLCRCNLERSSVGTLLYGYKNIEFGADIDLIAKRALKPMQYFIFTRYHIWGLLWYSVCDKVKMNRGNFFHTVYGIEALLGRALMETDMFPPHKYFSKQHVDFSQVGKPTQKAPARG